jgi:monoamine oxidase
MAQTLGYALAAHDDAPWQLFAQGQPLDPGERNRALAAVDALEQRISGHAGADVPLTALCDPRNWAERWAGETLGPLDAGADSALLSVRGLQQHGSTRPNWLVREGFGTVVAGYGADLPVALGERVSEIDCRGPRVVVRTSGGDVDAAACIVTVSTGVLRAEAIRFRPGLPLAKLHALDALPMGHFTKVILELDACLPGLPPGSWVAEARPPAQRTMHFLCHPFGSRLVIGLAGGAYGEALARLPEAAAVQEGLARLLECVGVAHGRRLLKGAFTGWATDPLHLGAYAYLVPGGGNAREVLGEPVDERLHFAGEAVALELMQTCGGAFLSGRRAADRILASCR